MLGDQHAMELYRLCCMSTDVDQDMAVASAATQI